MAKTRRMITENIKNVDAVIEMRDARIPLSSKNPEIERLIQNKPRLILLNKASLANPADSIKWIKYLSDKNTVCILTDCSDGTGFNEIMPALKKLCAEKLAAYESKGMHGRHIRAMVLGIPNVGKSSFINRLAGGKRAKVEDRPGVTRDKQWVQTKYNLDLLDMPGVLWPKFDDPTVGENLALTGAVKDDVIDTVELSAILVNRLRNLYPELLCARYKLTEEEIAEDVTVGEIFDIIGKNRGFLLRGGEINYDRAAAVILDEFRAAKIGRITLDICPSDGGNQ
jgi:ribosome biogenesis GTPase A